MILSRLFYLSLILAVFTPIMGIAQAETRHFTAAYQIYIRGILLSRVDIQLDISAADYQMRAHVAPAGFGRVLSSSHIVSTTKGSMNVRRLTPQRLDLNWTSDAEIYASFIRYENGIPVEFSSDYEIPPEDQPQDKVAFASIGENTTDPFLAMLVYLPQSKLDTACDGVRRIFDGRRLTTLVPQESTLSATLNCTLLWRPIAGYSPRSMERANTTPPIKTQFAQIDDTPFAAPLEIRGDTRYGTISIDATQFFTEVSEAPPAFEINNYSE